MAHAYVFLYVRTLHHHRHRRVNDFPSSSSPPSCPLQRARPSSLLGFAAAVDRRIDGGLVKLGDILKLKGVSGVW